MKKVRALSLFSGIGGIDLALNDYAETVAFCEQNEYCGKVLNQRFPNVPVFKDVKNINKDVLEGYGKGLAGERSGLFYEICRIAKEINPAFIFLENVPAIRTRGLKKVAEEFIKLRYDCRWGVLSAKELGGPHKRQRWFLLAYNSERKRENYFNDEIQKEFKNISNNQTLQNDNKEFFNPYASSVRLLKIRSGSIPMAARRIKSACNYVNNKNTYGNEGQIGENIFQSWNKNFTDWDRVDDGLSQELDENFWRVSSKFPYQKERLHALGNSVVPIVVKEAFERLIGLKK